MPFGLYLNMFKTENIAILEQKIHKVRGKRLILFNKHMVEHLLQPREMKYAST